MRHRINWQSLSWKRVWLIVLFGFTVGCAAPHFLSRGNHDLPLDPPQQAASTNTLKVKTESSGIAHNEDDNEAARDQLRRRIADLVAQQRYASAQAWARRFPEVSVDILRAAMMDEPTDDPALALIAATYDQQCFDGQQQPGWSEILRKRQDSARHHQPYIVARKELLGHLKQGRHAEAAKVPLPSLAKSLEPQIQIDAWHLTGMAQLQAGQNEGAIESFTEGLGVAKRHNPHQAAELALLLSDANRRVEQYDLATTSWQEAVLLGGELLESGVPLQDPNFWERASYLRPVDQRWPQAAEMQLVAASGLTVPDQTDPQHQAHPSDAAVWSCLGKWRLDRNEPQAALMTLKRAETMTGDPQVQEQIRLAQAQAMFRMEQTGAAVAMLVGLSQSQHPENATAAQALLGSIKLQSGQVQVGYSLLNKALKSDVQWHGRAEAEADLGLALLMLGDEQQGLKWLHTAQRRFERQGDHELLVKTLFNESEYHKSNKRKKEAAEPAERMLAIERTAAHLPEGMTL